MTFPRLVPPLVMSPGTDLIMTSQAEVMRIPELAATIEDHHWLTTYGLPIAGRSPAARPR
jgi:hypothetical protein